MLCLVFKQRGLHSAINFHLLVNQSDHFIDDIVGWHSKVLRRLVVASYQAIDGCLEQGLAPATILHEVEEEDVVEVGADLLLIIEVEMVVKFRKFQHNLYSFRLISAGEAAMLLSLEYSVAALKDKVRADGIFHPVEALVPILLLW